MKTVRADWSGTLLVCAKCSKKLGGGFGPDGRTSLAKALRRYLALGKGRKSRLGIVEVKCLGICPKGAVTVVDGTAPGVWRLVGRGLPIEDVAAALGVAPAPTAEPSPVSGGSASNA